MFDPDQWGRKSQGLVTTDFEDELGEAATVHLPQVTAGLNMAKFREKARAFLKAHESHLSLQRLRRNQPLTTTDLAELEKMLVDAGGSPELINEAREKSHGLGIFIRSLVGLDHEAAMQAFSEFISGTTATPNQIEFINLIVQELTQNGVMEPDRLFQSPFTDMNAQGPLGCFRQPGSRRLFKCSKRFGNGRRRKTVETYPLLRNLLRSDFRRNASE